jgi:protein TonB
LKSYKKYQIDVSDLQDSILVIHDIHSLVDPIETQPEFPGGNDALMQYIKERAYYPSPDICVQGRVVLRFVVMSSGDIKDIEVLRSLHPDFDKIAIEAVKSMPQWIPAKRNGQPVDCYYVLPVSFK